MADVQMTDSFLADLTRQDARIQRKTLAIMLKLANGQAVTDMKPVKVTGGTLHSIWVTPQVRAVARKAGGIWQLLFVGHHDKAYRWTQRRPDSEFLPPIEVVKGGSLELSSPAQSNGEWLDELKVELASEICGICGSWETAEKIFVLLDSKGVDRTFGGA